MKFRFWTKMALSLDPKLVQNLAFTLVQNLTFKNGPSIKICCVWMWQHSQFILNKYSVKNMGTTAHQNNYHKPYNSPICSFGECYLADTKYLVNYKLRQRNLHEKIKGIWIGKAPTTDERLVALPPQYDNHPSVTTSIYKCRSVTRLPKTNVWDTTFLATVQWPRLEATDYIEPDISENHRYLLESNASTR